MDRKMLEQHLAQAEGHVVLGSSHIVRQRELIAKLEQHEHDTVEARRLLATFESMQQQHLAHRDRLRAELAAHL